MFGKCAEVKRELDRNKRSTGVRGFACISLAGPFQCQCAALLCSPALLCLSKAFFLSLSENA